jgi:NAD(P)-dependent dehydrogenase (short-subunit alcohol dehydrogenase family)
VTSKGGRLKGRIALVTGASRGLGAAIARRFAAEGAHLVLVARTVGGLEEVDDTVKAAGGEATLVPLDLTQFEAIDELGSRLYERFGRLDILVGNAAALGAISPVGHIEPKLWEETFAINVTANFRLIRSFDPLLRQSEAGQAIFVTSAATKNLFPFWGLYSTTKSALDAMVLTYAREVANTTVRANLVDPGIIQTSMRAAAMPGEDPTTLRHPDDVTTAFVDLADANCTRNGEVIKA